MLRRLKATASLAMQTNVHIQANRLRPSRQSAGQDIPGRVPVPVRGISADAGMPALAQRLSDGRAALGTGLRSSARVYCDDSGTGAFSLVPEDLDELVPASIEDRSRQPVVPGHPLNIQAFHRDQAIAVNQVSSGLVMQVAPGVGDLRMNSGDLAPLLPSVFVRCLSCAKAGAAQRAISSVSVSAAAPARSARRRSSGRTTRSPHPGRLLPRYDAERAKHPPFHTPAQRTTYPPRGGS